MAEENIAAVAKKAQASKTEKVKKPKANKGARFKNFAKGILRENPLFVMVLGTCPALATTTSIEAAIGMGLLFSIVLICSNVLISLLRKIIPEEIRTPAYIVVIATFVTIVKMLTNAFLPELYSTLGVFISLIVVNCIVLGRAEAFASKNTVLDSLLDGCGMGLGYTLALLSLAFFREVFGSGMITIGKIFPIVEEPIRIPLLKYKAVIDGYSQVVYDYSIPLLQQPTGAFIVFGCVMGLIGFLENRKADKETFFKRFKGKVVESEDDKNVKLSRILFSVAIVVLIVISFDAVFVDPLMVNGASINWHQVYFGADGINGAIPAFMGYILMLVSMILAFASIFFYKKWNLKYIWLTIASGIIAIIGGVLALSTGFIYEKINQLSNVSLTAGPLVGGIISIIAGFVAFGGLIGSGLIDSYYVAHPRPVPEKVEVTSEVKAEVTATPEVKVNDKDVKKDEEKEDKK